MQKYKLTGYYWWRRTGYQIMEYDSIKLPSPDLLLYKNLTTAYEDYKLIEEVVDATAGQ